MCPSTCSLTGFWSSSRGDNYGVRSSFIGGEGEIHGEFSIYCTGPPPLPISDGRAVMWWEARRGES